MSNPTVLIVDDRADDERGKLMPWSSSLNLVIRYPQDVTVEDLATANVVVVDFRLDEPWQERDEASCISLKPMNGLALLSVLKSHERTIDGSPTAFVLRSEHLSDLTAPLPADTRLHIIALQNGLEWVLNKQTEPSSQIQQIIRLAEATAQLPESWPKDSAERTVERVQQWLRIPNERWTQLAWQDIEDCHPPIHELDQRKHGLRLVRWMTQRIFPYPCFLTNEARLATRLKVSRPSLREARSHGLDVLLAPAKYEGALHELDGEGRWWRSGVESILWELTEGRSFDTKQTIELLNQRCGDLLQPLSIRQPVLCLDRDFRWRAEPVDIEDAVRIQPDDWPVFAEQAWAVLADAVADPRVAAAVIAADREKLMDAKNSEDA